MEDSELEINQRVGVVPAIRVQRQSKYGGVAGLDEVELVDPVELERLVAWQMWGPVLELGPQWCRSRLPYSNDGSGMVDWDEVGTVKTRTVLTARDEAWSLRRICGLLGSEGVLRVRVRRVEMPRLPERTDEYPDYEDLVRWGMLPSTRCHRRGRGVE